MYTQLQVTIIIWSLLWYWTVILCNLYMKEWNGYIDILRREKKDKQKEGMDTLCGEMLSKLD